MKVKNLLFSINLLNNINDFFLFICHHKRIKYKDKYV